MDLSECEFTETQGVGKPGLTESEFYGWDVESGSNELLKDLDSQFTDNILECIVLPENTDSGYCDSFPDIPLAPKFEADCLPLYQEPFFEHLKESSPLIPTVNWSITTNQLNSEDVLNSSLKLQPWEPPENYEVPNFNIPNMYEKGIRQKPGDPHSSDLLSYYSLLAGDMSSSQVTFGVDSDFKSVYSSCFDSSTLGSPVREEIKYTRKRMKKEHSIPFDMKKMVIPRSRRGRQSKDEDLAREFDLPVSANELCMMSHVDLQNLLKRDDLTEDQKEMMKKLRRRGRNKIAARRCRAKRLTGGMLSGEEGGDPEDEDLLEDFEEEEEDIEETVIPKLDESIHGRKRKPTVKLSY